MRLLLSLVSLVTQAFFLGAMMALPASAQQNAGSPDSGSANSGSANSATVNQTATTPNLVKTSFGTDAKGQPVDIYTLKNANGMVAKVTDYGATLTELWVPDPSGKIADVVLGFDSLSTYENTNGHFGGIIGRYANRIAGASFHLDGQHYLLSPNSGPNTVHGGVVGFDKHIWKAETMNNSPTASVKLTYFSRDMEEGFPGNLTTSVTYSLTADNALKIDYAAHTDKDTVINLTNHTYFNLAGAGNGNILHHVLQINADSYLPNDPLLVPTGQIVSVSGTPFDFRQPKEIGQDISQVVGGYDNNYILNSKADQLFEAAVVTEPTSKRVLHVLTTEPAVQFYSGNSLSDLISGIGGTYGPHHGFCLEAQHFSDSVHHPNFPTTILRPGQTYQQTTIYKFGP
jgi:aldose 1-epimerase